MSAHPRESVLRVLPGMQVATERAVCEECGAHAAVFTAGASFSGACTVCGSSRLHVMDGHLPPPRNRMR